MAKPKGFFAKSGPAMMVLLILEDKTRYGYEISKELERLSESELSFQFGTLYPILHKLESDGLIQGVWEQPDGERSRRIYEITPKGRAELAHQVEAWEKYASAVDKVLQNRVLDFTTILFKAFGGH